MPRLSQVHPDPDRDPAPAQGQGNAGPNAPPEVNMRKWIVPRLAQALLAATALAAEASGHAFVTVNAFRILVSAAALQCLWSLALAILNFYAFLVGRFLQNPQVVAICVIGDWITGTLTFSASSTSATITVFMIYDYDMKMEACYQNHCPSITSPTMAMAFLSWFCLVILNGVVKRLQGP